MTAATRFSRPCFDLTGRMNSDGSLQPTSLPVSIPQPALEFSDRKYCFTGTFRYGTRIACENAVLRRGGTVHPHVTLAVDYLVIGSEATDDWLHSSYGSKISTPCATETMANRPSSLWMRPIG